jgi:hypothetical protein
LKGLSNPKAGVPRQQLYPFLQQRQTNFSEEFVIITNNNRKLQDSPMKASIPLLLALERVLFTFRPLLQSLAINDLATSMNINIFPLKSEVYAYAF